MASLAALLFTHAGEAGAAAAIKAKYYFRVGEVKAPADTDPAQKQAAGEVLRSELSGRANWASDIGAAENEAALVAELKKRGLRGFDVTLRVEEIKRDTRDPNPGGRLKRLAINVRLTVFGTAIPGAKLAFSGDGEAGVEAEVHESRMDAEAALAIRDAMKDAIRQAVDQAEAKLALGTAAPMNESKRRKK